MQQRGLMDTYGQNLRRSYELLANIGTIRNAMGSGKCVVGELTSGQALYIDDLRPGSNWISVRGQQCETYSANDNNAVTDANVIYAAASDLLAPVGGASAPASSSIMDDLARLFAIKDTKYQEDDTESVARTPAPVSSISNVPFNLFDSFRRPTVSAPVDQVIAPPTPETAEPIPTINGDGTISYAYPSTNNAWALAAGILALGAVAYLILRR